MDNHQDKRLTHTPIGGVRGYSGGGCQQRETGRCLVLCFGWTIQTSDRVVAERDAGILSVSDLRKSCLTQER